MNEPTEQTRMDVRRLAVRLAILWAFLFSLNALSTCIMVGLGNAVWDQMRLQAKFVLCLGVFANWSGTMMAYISKAVANIEHGKILPTNGENSLLTKTDITTRTETTTHEKK